MSTRAMSLLPLFRGERGGYNNGGDDGSSSSGLSGLLARITGQDQTSGGFGTNADGTLSWTPEAAKSPHGIFAGGAKHSAKEHNYAMGPQVMQNQAAVQLQKLINEHETSLAELNNKLAKDLATNQHMIDLAKAHDIPVDKLAGDFANKLLRNSSQNLDNKNAANDPTQNPDIQAANRIGANIGASGIPPALLNATAGPNTLSTIPGLPGVNTPSGSGQGSMQVAGPIQQQSVSMNQYGQMLPTSSVTPGGISIPVNPKIKAGALSLNAADNQAVPAQDDNSPLAILQKIQGDNSAVPTQGGSFNMFPQAGSQPLDINLDSLNMNKSNPSVTPVPANDQKLSVTPQATTQQPKFKADADGVITDPNYNIIDFLKQLLGQAGGQLQNAASMGGR